MGTFVEDATVVLVHGAWADGSSWAKVVGPLQEQGLEVTCAQLPLSTFAEDVEVVRAVVDRTSGPVLLVGHAYAGAVIGAVEHERVKGLVFVAALAPSADEAVANVLSRDPKHENAPELAPDERGYIWMPRHCFTKAFAQNASYTEMALSAAVQRPISVECITVPVKTTTWTSKPSWFLVANEDRMINPATQRFMAERMGATVVVEDVDHTPLISAHEAVEAVVLGAARAVLKG
ncbi:alpha/beta fold hydrolase [Paraburkholderia flagellata]|uniref:alpha/beta fold hydrolase n=1 Tax=Paraburkholderia flagellata TaxID=2883241 RepID=UPI001F37C765|nr:alpha/beta hydrolase [Paraburkholderia flagellata]